MIDRLNYRAWYNHMKQLQAFVVCNAIFLSAVLDKLKVILGTRILSHLILRLIMRPHRVLRTISDCSNHSTRALFHAVLKLRGLAITTFSVMHGLKVGLFGWISDFFLFWILSPIKSRISKKMRNHFKRKLSWVSDYILDLIFPPKIPFEMVFWWFKIYRMIQRFIRYLSFNKIKKLARCILLANQAVHAHGINWSIHLSLKYLRTIHKKSPQTQK